MKISLYYQFNHFLNFIHKNLLKFYLNHQGGLSQQSIINSIRREH